MAIEILGLKDYPAVRDAKNPKGFWHAGNDMRFPAGCERSEQILLWAKVKESRLNSEF